MELRRSRASFTSTLEKICQRLDDQSTAKIEWKNCGLSFLSQFKLESLWVVGSYARGAPDCGDLDLVAELAVEARESRIAPLHAVPPGDRVAKALFNRPRDVSLYIGTPAENESGVAFPEAVLIWQGSKNDWREAINSIQTDPTARRFSRPTNTIPLRPEQLNCDVTELEKLVDLEEQKIFRWTFVPMGDATPVESFSKDELELSQVVNSYCGQKTQKLLPYLVTYLRQVAMPTPLLRANFDKTMFGIAGAKVLVGRPRVPIYELDELATSQLLIVPHESSRGPNGVWVIERGDAHPLVLAAEKLRVYGLFEENGNPSVGHLADYDGDFGRNSHSRATCADFFKALRKAKKWAKELNADDEPYVVAKELSPKELLTYLSRVDVAIIDNDDFAVTWRGKTAINSDEVVSSQTVFESLSS